MKTTPWKPLREQESDIQSAIYERLGVSVHHHQNEQLNTEFNCRHCGNSFALGNIRIGSAPGPQWYELLCPGQLPDGRYCDGSVDSFRQGNN